MCSVFDFIERQKHLIENHRKTVENLYQFLSSVDKQTDETIDRNTVPKDVEELSESKLNAIKVNEEKTHKKLVLLKEIKDSDKLMLEPKEDIDWFRSAKSDQNRRHLSEERRREYHQFLEQKSRHNSDNQKRKPKRVTNFVPNYNELLNKKRIEEQKYREFNGFDEMDSDIVERLRFQEDKKKEEPLVPIVGWFHCSNNKFVPEYITPRSRLLCTHSSRLKAIHYREELRKQIEEKNKIKAEEREKIQLEEELLEQKVEAQRLKLLKEYEDEKKALLEKALELRLKDHVLESVPKREYKISSSSPLSIMRSPTYMPLKESRESSTSPKKSSKASRSLASAMIQSARTTQSAATQTSAGRSSNLTSGELSDSELSSEDEESADESPNEDQTNEKEFRKRILSQLSEVRQMMESDHIVMMNQLRQQQQQLEV